ncbi:hypothetical protein CEXT_353971 [Caerostris extrusa]|uniref:Uncharacterized protein n=1 Tax=Caerostris extrusa TaxID=172846 RepID=A0AAV4NJF8_CAEEX|nr:hypothetical protein CEXT_353971 [Caerostris extrusa]
MNIQTSPYPLPPTGKVQTTVALIRGWGQLSHRCCCAPMQTELTRLLRGCSRRGLFRKRDFLIEESIHAFIPACIHTFIPACIHTFIPPSPLHGTNKSNPRRSFEGAFSTSSFIHILQPKIREVRVFSSPSLHPQHFLQTPVFSSLTVPVPSFSRTQVHQLRETNPPMGCVAGGDCHPPLHTSMIVWFGRGGKAGKTPPFNIYVQGEGLDAEELHI